MSRQMTHGAQYAFRTGCRCEECKKWHAANTKAYRARRAARTGSSWYKASKIESAYRAITVTGHPDQSDPPPRFNVHGDRSIFATLWIGHDMNLATTDPQWLQDIGNVALAAATALENAQAAEREVTS